MYWCKQLISVYDLDQRSYCTTVCLLYVCKCSHCLGSFSRISCSFPWHSSFTQGCVCCVHRPTQSPWCHFIDTILSHNNTVPSVAVINTPVAGQTQDLTKPVHYYLCLLLWPSPRCFTLKNLVIMKPKHEHTPYSTWAGLLTASRAWYRRAFLG